MENLSLKQKREKKEENGPIISKTIKSVFKVAGKKFMKKIMTYSFENFFFHNDFPHNSMMSNFVFQKVF